MMQGHSTYCSNCLNHKMAKFIRNTTAGPEEDFSRSNWSSGSLPHTEQKSVEPCPQLHQRKVRGVHCTPGHMHCRCTDDCSHTGWLCLSARVVSHGAIQRQRHNWLLRRKLLVTYCLSVVSSQKEFSPWSKGPAHSDCVKICWWFAVICSDLKYSVRPIQNLMVNKDEYKTTAFTHVLFQDSAKWKDAEFLDQIRHLTLGGFHGC